MSDAVHYERCPAGPFAGCPGDVDAYAARLDELFSALRMPGMRSSLYHWKKSYDPGATGGSSPDQHRIARTRDVQVSPVFILFGRMIGSAAPRPREGWGELRTWLDNNGWGERIALLGEPNYLDRDAVPEGRIPLSGTMFELFDVLSSADDTDLRVFDLSAIAPPPDVPAEVLAQQTRWLRAFLEEYARRYNLIRPETPEDFDAIARRELKRAFGLGALDPRSDPLPGLEAVSDGSLLFGRSSDIERLTRRVFDDRAAFTVVLGRSGTGKSSLLRAGLLPNWYGRGLLHGARHNATSVVVEPGLLAPEAGADPLRALGGLLRGEWDAAGSRALLRVPLGASPPAPELPAATGDLGEDLPVALAWWETLTADKQGPIVLLLDQAEQIDAMAREAARAAQEISGAETPAAATLSAGWRRFVGLLAALAGRLDDAGLAEALGPRLEALEARAPLRLVLGLHRRSALGLWPLTPLQGLDEVRVEPLVLKAQWEEVVAGTIAAYGLEIDPALLDRMTTEAAALAGARDAARPPADIEESDDDLSRGSVLPQVVTALQRMLTAWRAALAGKASPTPADLRLGSTEFGALAQVETAIDALGEEAWADWRMAREAASGPPPAGYFSRRRWEEAQAQDFAGLMARLADGGERDLAYLAREGETARRHADLVAALRGRRLLTHADASYLRLSHGSILQHWRRARAWRESAAARLETKAALSAALSGRPGTRPPSDWSDADLEAFAALSLAWIGGGAGEDGALRARLRAALAERLVAAEIDYPGETAMQRLPFLALLAGERALFERLFETCLASPDLPSAAGLLCLLFAETGEAGPLERLLRALGPNAAADAARWEPANGTFPLLMAAQNGHADVVRQLLDAGAEVDRRHETAGAFPLLMAAQNGHADVARQLLDAGAEVDRRNETNGAFPLLIAAQNGHADVVRQLLDAGAEVDRRHETNGTFPLLQATQQGHADVVRKLLDAGAEVDRRNETNGTFPLLMAAQNRHADVVRHLLDAGAEVDRRNETNGIFPLLMAAQNGHADVVRQLLDAGAEVDRRNETNGAFPLLVAAENGHVDMVRHLLDAGAEVDRRNETDGAFPLLLAAQNGHADMVRQLLDAGAEVDRRHETDGAFPLFMAAQQGHADVVRQLLDAGAEVDRRHETNGTFPLLMAAQNGHVDVVRQLLDAGAEVDRRNETTGTFPLLQAAQNGHADVVRHLLDAGAEVDRRHETNGNFPLIMAAYQDHADVVRRLLDAGAEVDRRNETNGTFPLLMAAQNGHADVVRKLLDAGAEVDAIHAPTGLTALAASVAARRPAVARLLLERGADRDLLPPELADGLDDLLAERTPGVEDPGDPDDTQTDDAEGRPPPPPLPGAWRDAPPDDAFARQFNHVLSDLRVSPEAFRGLLASRGLPNFAGLDVDLHAAAFALDAQGGVYALDLLWLDPRRLGDPVPVHPGCDLQAILFDLLPRERFARMNDDDLIALAGLATVAAGDPMLPLIDPDAFAERNVEPIKRGGYPEEAWKAALVTHGPGRVRVELSALRGDSLLRVAVTFHSDPFRIEPIATLHVIAQGCEPETPPFAEGQPFRVLGVIGNVEGS